MAEDKQKESAPQQQQPTQAPPQQQNYPRTGFETSTSTGKNEKSPAEWDINKKPKQEQK